MIKRTLLTAAAAALAFASPSWATTLYATGFEAPAFSIGALAGQNGVQVFSASGQPGQVTVENSLVFDGAQAAEVGAVSGQTGPYYAYGPITPSAPIAVSAEIYVTQGNWQFAVLGPGLSQFAAGVDFTAGGIATAITSTSPAIGTFSADTWHNVALTLNYASQTYSISLDGALVGTGLTFCGSNAGCSNADVAKFGDVLFDSFSTSGAGYIDDVSVSTVPEAPVWAMMLIGVAGVGGALRKARRRRHSAFA